MSARSVGAAAAKPLAFAIDSAARAPVALPPIVTETMERLAEGDRATVGRRLAQVTVGALENPATRTVVLGRIRSASSQARYIVKIEPLASLEPAQLMDLLAPDFQRWRVEPLAGG